MSKVDVKELLEAGVHFGHMTRKWDPNMAPYIYMERNGIHIINLYKTAAKIEEANEALKKIAASGRKVLFVATKKQAKEVVKEVATRVNMPFVTDRWLGGMLTNFATIRKSVKKMQGIDKMLQDGTLESVTKKEKLVLTREKQKMERVLGGIANLNRVPAAVFLVDIGHEHIALKEAQRLNINTFGIVDTNCDPTKVDFAIPGNDDASKSISILCNYIADAIAEGLAERADSKEEETEEETAERIRFDADGEGDGDRKKGAGNGPRKRTGNSGGGRGKAGGAPRK